MKSKDFDQSIDVLDAEMTTIMERLDALDPSSDEYEKAAKNLKLIQESKQIEVRNKSEHLGGKIPMWGVWAAGAALSLGSMGVALHQQNKDGMFPTQMFNFWDKFRPNKF